MKLTVILANTWSTYLAMAHEGERRSYQKRTVQIDLTPEQLAKIEPRYVGDNGTTKMKEDIMECFLEP